MQINIDENLIVKYTKELTKYTSLLTTATDYLLEYSNEILDEKMDGLYQNIEIFDWTDINAFLNNIPKALRELIILNEHILPEKLKIMTDLHDERIEAEFN